MANTQWNPSDLVNYSVSGGGLIATSSGSAQGGVRAINSHRTGKFYWEVSVTNLANTSSGLGFGTSATALGSWAGGPGPLGIITVAASGNIYANNVNSGASIGSYATGALICVALDLVNKRGWFRSGAAGNWNGSASNDPAGNVGGISFASYAGASAIYPIVGSWIGADSWTANFGDTAFAGTPPAGFTAGFPAPSDPVTAITTQAALEQWSSGRPAAQVTQLAVEQWSSVAVGNVQALMTQITLEEWASVAQQPVVGAAPGFVMVMA